VTNTLVVVEGSAAAYAAALAETRRGGDELVDGFSARPGRICTGVVADEAAAASAVLAAIAGAGLVVHATGPREVVDRLLDDLRRLGPIEHRLGEPSRGALTSEQRRLLDALAAGHTLGEAARLVGLSRRSADRRLAEVRRTLGVATTAEAVVLQARSVQ
jgi:DNA-binding NarL/FixJ family response regulator